MTAVIAPWTEEQVEKLNAWQTCGHVHPFTCRTCCDVSGALPLVATKDGWVCEVCHSRQDWCHDFMLLGPPPLILGET